MPVNEYFTQHTIATMNEQNLLEDLIVESIEISGVDCYYIPRESASELSNILGEQPDTRFSNAYPVAIYMLNVEGYLGEQEFMTKFGFNIRASTNMVISAREFKKMVKLFPDPREGDLIYVRVLNRVFEIKDVDADTNFHSIGRAASRPYFYEMRTEQFKYSEENIQTGIPEIDDIERLNSYTMLLVLNNGSGNYVIGEEVFQGPDYVTSPATAKVVDWNPANKILSVVDIRGQINTSSNVTGTLSSTIYNVVTANPLVDAVPDTERDNQELSDDVNLIIVPTSNPLS